ncbi:hypothetical protein XSR1_440011 [Xenorhabdus szentirmaii DSM 16338]|uniref:Uncharacterized protein n=1 Tax=Xenorhabdus szentirmaii DSM 16338 TaxID=1427518 RepID=W1J2J9_9GAMM|nr:hypothetical protein XSR1_440011 [Xenorhabdus szentirmaii DSM 16338]
MPDRAGSSHDRVKGQCTIKKERIITPVQNTQEFNRVDSFRVEDRALE